MDKLNRLVWAGSSTYRIGPLYLGVRSDSAWLDQVLREALQDYWVPEVEAPPNYSIVISREDSNGNSAGLNMLYEGHTNLVRSRYPERAIRALFQHLAKYLPAQSDGLLRAAAQALVRDGRAILVPNFVVTWMAQLAPRLNRSGWQFVDQPQAAIDLEHAELVVLPPRLAISDSWLKELSGNRSEKEPDLVEPGRYPLAGWGVFSAEERVMSRAAGTAVLAMTITNPSAIGVSETVDGLLDITARIPVTGLGSPFEGDLAARLMAVDPN